MAAVAVCVETTLSEITVLSFGRMMLFMLPIHIVIGVCEGVATAVVILIVRRRDPELFRHDVVQPSRMRTIEAFAVVSLILAASFTLLASSNPDGLEWSLERARLGEIETPSTTWHSSAEEVIGQTALMPDYNTVLAGVVGCALLIFVAWLASLLLKKRSDGAKSG